MSKDLPTSNPVKDHNQYLQASTTAQRTTPQAFQVPQSRFPTKRQAYQRQLPSRQQTRIPMPPQPLSSAGSSPPPPPPTHTPRRSGIGRPQASYSNQDYNRGGGGGGGSRRRRGYSSYDGKRASNSSKITIVLVVWAGASSGFRRTPVTFDKNRTTDEELWSDIRYQYRNVLEKPWRRLILFKTLKFIAPIEFTKNDVPKRQTDPKNLPGTHEFMHAYRHPTHLRTTHDWVDWFVEYRHDQNKTYGLEFVEGLWAEKLAIFVIIFMVANIVVSVVWAVYGGQLQTIFSVMGFVLTAVAADVAFIALYYQVSLPG